MAAIPHSPDLVRLAERRMIPKIFMVWTAVMMLTEARRVVQVGGDIWCALLYGLVNALIWTVFTFGLFALTDRFPLDRPRWRSLLLIAPLVMAGWIVRMFLLAVFTFSVLTRTTPLTVAEIFQNLLRASVDRALIDSCVVLWLGHALRTFRTRQAALLRASDLSKRLAVAQLDCLRTQLQPHFLFNTLNSIAALVGDDTQGALRMIARLSELLRLSLATMQARVIPLAKELEIVGRYLEIQKMRFAELVHVKIDVADDCLDALVPPFLLQPLVENAIKHGVMQARERCRIRIEAHREGNDLRIEIENDNTKLRQPIVEGIGVSNTRHRLRVSYEDRARFQIDGRGEVVTVRLMLPYETEEEELPRVTPLDELVPA